MRPKSQGFGSSAQKLNHPFFVIAACYADWTPGVCAKTARKRQIGPNGLLASTACTFQRRLLIIIFGRSFKTCAPLRRETYVGSPGLYPCGRNGLLASTACTFLRRLLIIIVVRFFKTCAPLRLFWVAWAVSLKSPAPLGRPGPDPCSPKWLPQAPSKATTEN